MQAASAALTPLADPVIAIHMRAYMKDIAPFFGIMTPARRAALRAAWKPLAPLTEASLSSTCRELWSLQEREYQYAACDLIARHSSVLSADFIGGTAQELVVTKPWWDTVDSLGGVAITPVVARHPELVDLMWTWLDSGDRWLIRAAIQHQRGLKDRTDLDRLFAMCDRFASDREFFIAKAIGWALRDAARLNAESVRVFVDTHSGLSAVARREAERGLARQS
ncbi:MAG: DNA alkylation repair protein [Actinobacteria bacterium]|nr:DNA alkylation repair protein [Actinomycetota bacterium]